MRPDYPEARANLALALLTMGRLGEGFREYVPLGGGSAGDADVAAAALDRPDLHGETVLLHAEQGFGDTLQFCRYAPMVAASGGRVILVVPKALRRLLTTLDGVAAVLSEEDDLPPFDYQCPLLSLPFAFGTTMATIPAPISICVPIRYHGPSPTNCRA